LIKDERVKRERERERERKRKTDRERETEEENRHFRYVKKIDVNNVWLGTADRSGGKNGVKGKVIKKGILIRK
jgi:hypothetical protein